MLLTITPDFEAKDLKDCIQELKIIAKQDIQKIELDAAEMKIHGVSCFLIDDNVTTTDNMKSQELPCEYNQETNDKLIIEWENKIIEGSKVSVIIKYSVWNIF